MRQLIKKILINNYSAFVFPSTTNCSYSESSRAEKHVVAKQETEHRKKIQKKTWRSNNRLLFNFLKINKQKN